MEKTCYLCLYVLIIAIVTGCAHCRQKDDEKMLSLADSLTKLSTKVESAVRYGNPPDNAPSDELLKLATQHDPEILDGFAGYKIRINSKDRHAVVLLCSNDGQRGLLEDLGCTGRLDRNLWREMTEMPCAFTLSVELGCGGKH